MRELSLGHRWMALAVVVALLTLVGPRADAGDAPFRIIVHPDNPTVSMSRSAVSQMLLKQTSKWAHGEEVEPVDLAASSPTREAFSRDVHGRSLSSIKSYERQIFSGGKVPPPELASDAAVITFVSSRPGAIGYVSSGARLAGVKELKVSD